MTPRSLRSGPVTAAMGLLWLIPGTLVAKIGPATLDALVDNSELIVVARVEGLERSNSHRFARAQVIESWKGLPEDTLQYDAESSWVCDIADAKVGETTVLFLNQIGGTGRFRIVHAGRGRMPLREVSGEDYATVWVGDVELPSGTPTIDGPEPRYDFIRSVSLAALRSLVRERVFVSERAAARRTNVIALSVLAATVVAGVVWFQRRTRGSLRPAG